MTVGTQQSPNPSAFPTWLEGILPGLVPPSDMINPESVVEVKHGDSGVIIGYQIDEFTPTCSAEYFVAHLNFTLGSWTRCKLHPLPA